ncbi:hypothetical protein [Streptomyces wuyuanensis]|uniref:hypothetical protein n=1 Tax=Streptomyces wuyuanensis TaxID=1196353 RepID=UPI003D70D9C9
MSVRTGVESPRLRIEVSSPPAEQGPALREPVSGGTGTLSMRERVESTGGALKAGARDGSYRVRGLLPAGFQRRGGCPEDPVAGASHGPGLGPGVRGAP